VIVLLIVALVLFVWFLVLALGAAARKGDELMDSPGPAFQPADETTLHPQAVDGTPDAAMADMVLLAKIMAAEDGADWPDWAVMCIGEVVLNRVASPAWPDTIRDVLYQNGPPIQYEPVWSDGWDELEPGPEYIDLARRLLAGERPMNDPEVVWQALFPQGSRTVVTYYDKTLDTTTYFCK
jgi:N-acetylmuramoyl-L-alanine amidase